MATESREELAKRLIAEVCAEDVILRDMRALVERIAASDPQYHDAEEGPFCTFCLSHWKIDPAHRDHGYQPTHAPDCDWVIAGDLVARWKAVHP